MAATYFNCKDESHRALLPKGIRTHEELERVAEIAEAAVIAYYTKALPYTVYTERAPNIDSGVGWIDGATPVGEVITNPNPPSGAVVPQLAVYLRGYKQDADDPLVDPNFKIAMRRTIAEVIRWRLGLWQREQAISSSSDQVGKSRSYTSVAEAAFPLDWNLWLKPYESAEPVWGF